MAIRGLTGWLGVVLGTPDPPALARFYSRLFGWAISSEDPTRAAIRSACSETPSNSCAQERDSSARASAAAVPSSAW